MVKIVGNLPCIYSQSLAPGGLEGLLDHAVGEQQTPTQAAQNEPKLGMGE